MSDPPDVDQRLADTDMFVGVLSHDLRNPLAAIITGTALIKQLAYDRPRILATVARIQRSADRMQRMIDQLLDFTHVRMGEGLPMVSTDTCLAEVVHEALEEVESPNLRLEVRGEARGMWDRDRLSQVVSNLAANALQHGSHQAPVIVRVDGRQGATVRLEVANGGRIADELLPHVFEPMRASAASKGLGLGLFITHHIVTRHGGQISVASDDAIGTVFAVELPRRTDA